MSAPAAKALSEPVITMQPIALSASRRSAAASSSSRSETLSALSACGRLRRMRPTRPRVSTSTVSLLMASLNRSRCRLSLAQRAEECRSAALHDALDGTSAARPRAPLAGAVIDAEPVLEVAKCTIGAAMVAQGGAAGFDCVAQHRLDGLDQNSSPLV